MAVTSANVSRRSAGKLIEMKPAVEASPMLLPPVNLLLLDICRQKQDGALPAGHEHMSLSVAIVIV